MNFGLNLWNKVFGRMFGLTVMLTMTLSGHSWIINKIRYTNHISIGQSQAYYAKNPIMCSVQNCMQSVGDNNSD